MYQYGVYIYVLLVFFRGVRVQPQGICSSDFSLMGEREEDRQADRQTGRDRDRQTNRDRDREREREISLLTSASFIPPMRSKLRERERGR